MEGDAMYGWRRFFMDLHERWETDARVKDLLVGHSAIRTPERSSTRVRVYLVSSSNSVAVRL